MVAVENDKPKTEKTSASVTLTWPKLCPKTKLDFKNTTSNIPKPKSQLLRNRKAPYENTQRPGFVKNLPINFHKSKFIETAKNNSLIVISPKNYHGQIPLFQRHSLSALTMSPPVTRFSSPLKRNSPKGKQNKIKTISLEQEAKKSTKGSRSPSPTRKERSLVKQRKSKQSSPTGTPKSQEKNKRGDAEKTMTSLRVNSPAKKKSKIFSSSKLDLLKESVVRSAAAEEANILVFKQSSQPSLGETEKLLQPQEKISLDHLQNELYTGDHKRLSFEKVHLCIEKKEMDGLNLGERKRSYLLTYSSEDLQKEDISLSFLKNLCHTSINRYTKEDINPKLPEGDSKSVIRTLSGKELILTPSMKLLPATGEIESEDVELSKLLNETEGQKEIHIPQDDASEYDSEVSTDGELARKDKARQQSACRVSSYKDMQKKSISSFWKDREAELLNDVDYRQSVYHPAISRRQNDENYDVEFMPKSKSIENNFEFAEKLTDTVVRCRSQVLHTHIMDNVACSSNDRTWAIPFDKDDGKECYTNVIKTGPLYNVKRIRTNKERVTGALLHFTLKIIRLLAIFNFWPGDNSYILTSQSLRFAR